MPPLRQPFPHGNFTHIWETCLNTVKADPILRPAIKLWQCWGGAVGDDRPPSDSDLPWLRITPSFGPGSWSDETSHRFQMIITHEMGVAGTDVRDLMDMWECIIGAWFRGGSNNLLNSLIVNGGWQVTVSGPGPTTQKYGETMGLAGTGVFTIDLDMPT